MLNFALPAPFSHRTSQAHVARSSADSARKSRGPSAARGEMPLLNRLAWRSYVRLLALTRPPYELMDEEEARWWQAIK